METEVHKSPFWLQVRGQVEGIEEVFWAQIMIDLSIFRKSDCVLQMVRTLCL